MYKGLYDQFKHWFHDGKGQVWFYSDPHFADEEMKYLRANYIGDDEQIKRINSKIGKYDTIVILGDIGDINKIKKLRGYKVLIMGNHDSGATNYQRQRVTFTPEQYTAQPVEVQRECAEYPNLAYGKIYVYDNHLFDEVYEGALIVSEKLILSHEPVDFPYALNIHGHDHSLWSKEDALHWNMCAEHIDYTPVCLKHIIESGRLKNITTIHRDIIDEATARKRRKEKNNGRA